MARSGCKDWPERARAAAVQLSGDQEPDEDTLGIRLLADCRAVFGDADRIGSADLCDGLHEIEEAPWGHFKNDKPLSRQPSPRSWAASRSRVAPFGSPPRTPRRATCASSSRTPGGAIPPPNGSAKASQRHNGSLEPKTPDFVTSQENPVTDGEAAETALESQCDAVTDRTSDGAAKRIRRQVRELICRCVLEPEFITEDGRCGRCYGRRGER